MMAAVVETVERAEPLNISVGCSVQPKSGQHIVQAGVKAWARLKQSKTWDDWLCVGAALEFGRIEAMRSANTNKPAGRQYNQEFGDWLTRNGLAGIDKSIRRRLFLCLAHRTEIETWRAILTDTKRMALNHPVAVLRRWQKTQIKKPDETAKKPSYVARLNDALVESQEEVARLRRDVERNGDGDRWTPESSAAQVAAVILGTFKDWKVREIVRACNQGLKKKGAP